MQENMLKKADVKQLIDLHFQTQSFNRINNQEKHVKITKRNKQNLILIILLSTDLQTYINHLQGRKWQFHSKSRYSRTNKAISGRCADVRSTGRQLTLFHCLHLENWNSSDKQIFSCAEAPAVVKRRESGEKRKNREIGKSGCAGVDGKALKFLSPGSTRLNPLSPGSTCLNSLVPLQLCPSLVNRSYDVMWYAGQSYHAFYLVHAV